MRHPPAISIIGWSGAGKTSLVERLVPELSTRGLRVALVKHSSDAHPLHRPGSDTARFQELGATLVGFATPAGVQLTTADTSDDALLSVLTRFRDRVDLVVVEGWKNGPLFKLEVWREGLPPPLATTHPDVLALVTDAPTVDLPLPPAVRRVSAKDTRAVADVIIQALKPGRLHEA